MIIRHWRSTFNFGFDSSPCRHNDCGSPAASTFLLTPTAVGCSRCWAAAPWLQSSPGVPLNRRRTCSLAHRRFALSLWNPMDAPCEYLLWAGYPGVLIESHWKLNVHGITVRAYTVRCLPSELAICAMMYLVCGILRSLLKREVLSEGTLRSNRSPLDTLNPTG